MAETDIADIVPRGAVLRVGKCCPQIVRLDEELESTHAVDLDDGKRDAVAPLEGIVAVDPDHGVLHAELTTHGRHDRESLTTEPAPFSDVEDNAHGGLGRGGGAVDAAYG